MPVFSVIVPVYNVAPWLRECLDSIAAQTFTDWECVCVDDGSSDGSGAILDEYAAADPRFRVIHWPNAGASAARNAALERIRGTFFLFVDADDAIVADAFEIFLFVFRETGDDAILCAPYDDQLRIEQLHAAPKSFEIVESAMTPLSLLASPYAPNGYVISRVFRRSVFGLVRFPDGIKTAEDIRYQFDALAEPARWTVIRKKYYGRRSNRPGSASHAFSPRFFVEYAGAFTYAVKTMRRRIGATQPTIAAFVGKYRLNYLRQAIHPAFRAWRSFSNTEKEAFFAELFDCSAEVGFWPFRGTDRVRLALWRCGLGRVAFPFLFFLDCATCAIRRRWRRVQELGFRPDNSQKQH